jgi:hypothetical protein
MHLEVYCFCMKTWIKGTESQWVQRSKWGVPFVFKCKANSLPKVARTKVLQRIIPKYKDVKTGLHAKKSLYLDRGDDDAKMTQLKGIKSKMTREATQRRGDRTGTKWAQAVRPTLLQRRFGSPFLEREDASTLSCCRRHHSEWTVKYPRGRPQDREVGPGRELKRSFAREIHLVQGGDHNWKMT